MFRNCLIAIALTATPVWAADEDLKTTVDKSLKAMGAENVHTITISGDGFNGAVGQPCNPHDAYWRKYADTGYSRAIDLDMRAWHTQFLRKEGDPKGCGTRPRDVAVSGASRRIVCRRNFQTQRALRTGRDGLRNLDGRPRVPGCR